MNKLSTRSMSLVQPSTFNPDQKSVKAIATTEKPVTVFDWQSYDYVDEILRTDGCVLPDSGRVPLLNSHSRYSVEDVLGSALDFKMLEKNESGVGFRALEATVIYSDTDEGKSAAQKTQEGHLTDYSVGYKVLARMKVEKGATAVISGETYTGPVIVATKWELKELSATPIGADSYAKARSEHLNNEQKNNQITRQTNQNINDGERNMLTPEQKKALADAEAEKTRAENEKKAIEAAKEQARAEAIKAERERMTAINQRCSVAGIPEATAKDFIERGLSIDEASAEIFKRLEETSKPVGAARYEMGVDAADKFRAAAIDGIASRSGIQVEKPAAGFEDFRNMSLLRVAEECILQAGGKVRGMRGMEIAGMALGIANTRAIIGASTSDFPAIMSNVANKRLLQGYQAAKTTWDIFCNVVDARDFKPLQGIDISALPVLELLNENGEYKTVSISETEESYVVKSYGNAFYLTRTMIVNDDTRLFLKIPERFGAATQRTINQLVYSKLNSNPTLSDRTALFHADRKNLGTAGVPSSTTLSEGRKLMRQFKDISGKEPLNLTLKYLVAGSKHETNIDLILASTALPTAEMSSGVANPWRNALVPVIDATQDLYSEDAWYLFPEKTAADTIEVAFLDGVQAPYLEDMVDFDTDGIKYKCRIDFGVGVMSSKIVKNAGA